MARKEARVFTGIWDQPDWQKLSADAQWMYMFLISQTDIAHTGVLSLRERRWAQSAQGLVGKDILLRLGELEQAGYVVVDERTEEVLVRSFMRHDQVFLQPNLMHSAVAMLPAIRSHRVRHALWVEITRIVRDNGDRARAGRGEPPLSEKQKVPIRQMVVALKATGDGPSELESQPSLVTTPEPSYATRSEGGRPSRSPRSDLDTGLGHGDRHSSPVDDPSDPAMTWENNPSPNPSRNPLGDRGVTTGSAEGAPIPYPLSPIPTTNNTREADFAPALFDPPAPPVEPELMDFGPTPTPSRQTTPTPFDRFWEIYPRKEKKSYARQCWDKATRKATPAQIIAGARRYAEDPNRVDAYTAHASTWLNQERWDDPPMPPRNGRPNRAAERTQANLTVVEQLRAEEAARHHRQITTGGTP